MCLFLCLYHWFPLNQETSIKMAMAFWWVWMLWCLQGSPSEFIVYPSNGGHDYFHQRRYMFRAADWLASKPICIKLKSLVSSLVLGARYASAAMSITYIVIRLNEQKRWRCIRFQVFARPACIVDAILRVKFANRAETWARCKKPSSRN